jgi:2Fe-2S ferredoxin
MVKLTFVQPDGASQTVEVEPGLTVMEAAKLNDIAGIEAECGGACACATCHVYIDAAWVEKTGKPANIEEDMLDFAFDVRKESRLSCQIKVTPDLDGLTMRVPAKQF